MKRTRSFWMTLSTTSGSSRLRLWQECNKIEPLVKVSQWLVMAMTAVVLIYYVRDILVHLDIIH